MFHSSNDIGKELTKGNWGCETEKSLSEHISSIDDEREIKCLLCYIANLLEPISKVASWRVKEVNEKRHEENRKETKARMAIAKPWREKLSKLRDKDNFEHKYYNKVLYGISHCLRCYEYYDYGLETAKELLSNPVKEWQRREVLRLCGVGKVTAKGFIEYQETLP